MTHGINSNTNLLSIDITRTHTKQMRKSPRGEKESGKNEERQRERVKKERNQEINFK